MAVDQKAAENEIKAHLARIEMQAGERVDRLKTRVDDLEAEFRRPDPPGWGEKRLGGLDGYMTPGSRLINEHKNWIDIFRKTGRIRIDIGAMHPEFLEGKTLIDRTALGFSTPGVLGSQNVIDGIVPGARRRLTVRDILPSRRVDQAMMHFIREASFTNNASPQTEGSDKAESALTLEVEAERIRTIAHVLPITRQALDDLNELRRFCDTTLIYGLKVKEESELLFGDGLGEHLNGIALAATAYAGTYNVGSDSPIDRLRHAILEMEDADEQCTAFVMHPKDVHDIDLIKTEEGGANKGSYVVGDPLGGFLAVRTLWGRAVVSTRSMPSGRFLAGDFTKAIIGDRMDSTVDLSEHHSDYFVKNKVMLRAENRLAVAVLRAGAFRYGSF